LPIGVQIVGRPYEEEVVLAIAAHIERGCDGWKKPRNLQQRLPKH
jgi:Asp-tRNA(Asn)/Glu-tRNA(Gln) amidotransferase A subunit family amidase